MKNPSVKTKQKRHMGEGTQGGYRAGIRQRELRQGLGQRAEIYWPQFRRSIQLMSLNEQWEAYLLMWDIRMVDIQEQYPLNLKETVALCRHFYIKHPKDEQTPMTTDFLFTYIDDDGYKKQKAISVKDDEAVVFSGIDDPKVARTVEKQFIEMTYWQTHGIPFEIVFGSDINKIKANNIRTVMRCWDPVDISCKQHLICYFIAHRYLQVDMDAEPLDIQILVDRYINPDLSFEQIMERIGPYLTNEGIVLSTDQGDNEFKALWKQLD